MTPAKENTGTAAAVDEQTGFDILWNGHRTNNQENGDKNILAKQRSCKIFCPGNKGHTIALLAAGSTKDLRKSSDSTSL